MIEAYSKFWKNYVNFEGRTNRSDFWYATLINIIISLIINVGYSASGHAMIWTVLSSVLSIAIIIPNIAMMIRRLRDAGYAWTNIFWSFLPFIGTIILIIFYCQPSKK